MWRSRVCVHTLLVHSLSIRAFNRSSSLDPPPRASPRFISSHLAEARETVALFSMASSRSATLSKFLVSGVPVSRRRQQLSHLPQLHCSFTLSFQWSLRKRQRQVLTFAAYARS